MPTNKIEGFPESEKKVEEILSKYISYEPIEHLDDYDLEYIEKKSKEMIDEVKSNLRNLIEGLKKDENTIDECEESAECNVRAVSFNYAIDKVLELFK